MKKAVSKRQTEYLIPSPKNIKEFGLDPSKISEVYDDWSIDYDGDVDLSKRNLEEIPFKFNKVSGDFNCEDNQLTSLEGSPQEVGRDFWCHENQLTSLEGAPQEVGGSFDCSGNQLTSLKGKPEYIGGKIYS